MDRSLHRTRADALKSRGVFRFFVALIAMSLSALPASAGLYYSGETFAELPSQWRGFMLDQRSLRQIAVPAGPMNPASPLRMRYLEERKKLEAKMSLTGDEIADLGAILVRLGDVDRAVEVLRSGQGKHPNHFAIAANLGTAWQLKGDLAAAAESLRQAVRLAPGKQLAAEETHLKLVTSRMRQKRPGQLDELFGVNYFDAKDDTSAVETKKLTPRTVGLAQQLALWLPADGPLLWQLAELANGFGEVRTAAAFAEGCVVQFNMGDRDLRRRRLLFKEAAEKLLGDKTEHKPGHAGTLAFRSRRPLVSGLIEAGLPAVSETGINAIPWEVLAATGYEGKFPAKFSTYLKELDGKTVSLNGFMQPLNDEALIYLFIESPVGCWYCEMPDLTGMVALEAPAEESLTFQRGLQRVIGRLRLNATDPEDFLFRLSDAKLAPLD